MTQNSKRPFVDQETLKTIKNEDMGMSVDLIPEEFVTVWLNGHPVPNIKAWIGYGENDYSLFAGNVGITVEKDKMVQMVWFLANAMAVAAGYTGFSEYSQTFNPYKKSKNKQPV